jgi:hypothetical protein
MPSPSTVFTELVTTTLRDLPSEVSDNVSRNNALYAYLKKKGKVVTKGDGGYELVRPLDYAENVTFQRFSGYQTLSVQGSDVFTAAKYDPVEAVVFVTASGRELSMNRGRQQIIDLVKARITNAKRTAANNMSVDLYSNGAIANQIAGLQHIVQSNGQGTVGGIDSGTWTFWRNTFREYTGTPGKDTIQGEINAIYLDLVRGTDRPDLVISTHDWFAMLEASLQAFQRYESADTGELGFQALKYKGIDVIFDSNTNFTTTGQTMYFLNTDYLWLEQYSDAAWTVDEKRISFNQRSEAVPIWWMGQLTCSNRHLQGILVNLA